VEILDVSVICSTAFSPNCACLAIGAYKILRVYIIDIDKFIFGCPLSDSDGKASNHIPSITWTNDNEGVLCGCEDGKVRILSVTQGALVHAIEVGTGEVFQVALSTSNGYFVAAAGDGVLSLYELSSLDLLRNLQRETDALIVAISTAISPDDRYIAVGYSDFHIGV
jgi:WD40 repeat protein